jgi:proteasome lid subunit RPN8/RPN11
MDSTNRRPFARLEFPAALMDAMIAQARSELPNECCGVLAGSVESGAGRVVRHFAIRNDLASATEYFANPHDLLVAMKAMRADGLQPLAFYHSHPASKPVPSRADLARNYWGDSVMHLIIGLSSDEPEIRAWWLGETNYEAALMQVV